MTKYTHINSFNEISSGG